MTREEFLERIDGIMCGISNAERAFLEDLYDEVTKPRWISVEEELPPRDDEFISDMSIDVLVTDGKTIHRCFYDYNIKCWLDGNLWEFDNITHWMLLPQAPHHFADVSKKVKKGGEE